MANDFFTVESAQEVLEKYKDEVSNHRKYRILYSKTFTDYWNSRINKDIFFTIYFKTGILDELNIKEINDRIKDLNVVLLNNNPVGVTFVFMIKLALHFAFDGDDTGEGRAFL